MCRLRDCTIAIDKRHGQQPVLPSAVLRTTCAPTAPNEFCMGPVGPFEFVSSGVEPIPSGITQPSALFAAVLNEPVLAPQTGKDEVNAVGCSTEWAPVCCTGVLAGRLSETKRIPHQTFQNLCFAEQDVNLWITCSKGPCLQDDVQGQQQVQQLLYKELLDEDDDYGDNDDENTTSVQTLRNDVVQQEVARSIIPNTYNDAKLEVDALQTTLTDSQQTYELFENLLVELDDCDDVAPDNEWTCDDQKSFGKCEADWMLSGGYCRKTCGRCVTYQRRKLQQQVQQNSQPQPQPQLMNQHRQPVCTFEARQLPTCCEEYVIPQGYDLDYVSEIFEISVENLKLINGMGPRDVVAAGDIIQIC
eukprot:TRINITY_DN658_c3_g1_i3.p1 TRINITY_DN658_c3_g1~~TRINITY_DN658_c3_g1_i3.p1  ORF type:complete len:397 (-),score=58.61 TRINITY_DN658_c3_g1_i3:669-1748(-)